MANQHIDIQGSATRLAGQTRTLIDDARRLQEGTTRVIRIIEQVKAGAVGSEDWVALGAYLGIPAEKAQTFYGLLIAFQNVINKPNYDTFIDRLG